MRGQGHDTRGTEAKPSRTVPEAGRVARSVSADGPLTPGHVLALQRAAGNAAVARVIQRLRAGLPQEPDAGVGDVLRSAGNPLAPSVREDMESRLGADFSDVRVHTGMDARRSARDLGARAYTSGNHVVLGEGGGDQHTLTHELVHVVQQREGPVAGTDTGTGLRVSDPGDRFEREAEATAHRVLAGGPAHEHPETAHAHAAGQAAVQRATAQIVATQGDELTVDNLIAGRPESPHSGTEGDHTTAYAVLTQAVRRVTKGRTATQAAEGVWELYQDAKKLPGEGLRGNLATDGKHARLLTNAEAELARLHDLPAGTEWDMPRLQQLIGEYLNYRGTLPLSTLNIKAAGKKFGKGTGESSRIALLNRYEAGDRSIPKADIRQAVRDLLDTRALMAYAINLNAPSATVAPGTTDGNEIDDATVENRFRIVVEQHVASVAQAFPAAVADAWSDHEEAADELTGELKEALPDAKKTEAASYLDKLRSAREGGNTSLAGDIEDIIREYGQEPPPAPKEELGRGARLKNRASKLASGVASSPRKLGKAIGSGFRKPQQQQDEEEEAQQEGTDAIGPESDAGNETTSKIATQLVIEDGTITAMLSSGRARSPFPGTMGAHSTAWIALVDFIRTRLVHKDVTAAVRELPGLVQHVTQVAQRLESLTEDDDTGGLTARMASTHISEPAGEEDSATVETAQVTMDRLVAAATTALDGPISTQALLLQQAVGAILERLNLVPGVTRYLASTTGSGEATYRKMLLTGRRGRGRKEKDMKQKDYQDAVFGLLDMRGELSDEQRVALMRNHLAIITGAYPGALAKAGLSENQPEKALGVWKKRGKEPDDPFA